MWQFVLFCFQKCVSAKNSGMRFQSWREPKPLRSRCNSAVATASVDRECIEDRKVTRSVGRAPEPMRREQEERAVSTSSNEDVLARLSQPTASSKWKTTKARAREVGTDMNYYSWSRMNVYKAHQGVIYGSNGASKRPTGTVKRWSSSESSINNTNVYYIQRQTSTSDHFIIIFIAAAHLAQRNQTWSKHSVWSWDRDSLHRRYITLNDWVV